MISVTWLQNTSAAEPTLFEVKCQNDLNSEKVTVSNKTNSTEQLGPVLLSSSYNCCVSGVYRDVYVAQGRCIQIETPGLSTDPPKSIFIKLNVVSGVLCNHNPLMME